MAADSYRNYRVRGIPAKLDKYQAADLVKRSLGAGDHVEVCIRSLAPDLARPQEMVATLNFSEIPPTLRVAHARNEWSPFRVSLEQCAESEASLIFDTHFTGFTPLYCPAEADWKLDLVALSGLNGHAFGSFKSKKKSYMWLRDDLPRDLPEARILIYGYDTRLQDSASFQNIHDLGETFLRALSLATMESDKSLLILSHSLGGIVAKEAINLIVESPSEAGRKLLRKLQALYFFGAPSHGMDIESLVPMVGSQPNRGFLHTLETNSPVLRNQATRFSRIITRQRCQIVDFYETKMSETAQQDVDGKWAMTGPPRILVAPASAIHGIDEPYHHTHAIDRSHSDLVKFTSRHDEVYATLLGYFKGVRKALNTGDITWEMNNLQKCCLQSLAFPEQDRRKNELRPLKGTCNWLFNHVKYKSWLEQPNGLLWIRGKPGSGKSMLLRSAVQHHGGQKRTEQLVASFFVHAQGTDLERTSLGLYRSLLHQVYPYFPGIFADLVEKFDNKSNSMVSWQWNTNELFAIFANGLPEASKIRPIFIFIDALDELGEDHACRVVQDLERLSSELPEDSQLKICFSCRHYPELTLKIGATIATEDYNSGDIHTVVKEQLNEMNLSKEIVLVHKIVGRARGVFQWAAIVLDNARRMKRKGKPFRLILEMVEDVPAELHRLYDSLLADAEDRAQTVKLFQWILFPEIPLSVEQLKHALALDRNMTFTSIKEYRHGENYYDEEDMAIVVKHLSKGLAEIRGMWVGFIHQSVQDYLLETGLQALEKNTHGSSSSHAHIQISRSCIRFLSLDEIRSFLTTNAPPKNSELTARTRQLSLYRVLVDLAGPFIHYAWRYWGYHVAEAEPKESTGIDQKDLLGLFSHPYDEEFLKPWVTLQKILGNPIGLWDLASRAGRFSEPVNLKLPKYAWPISGSRLTHLLCLTGARSAIQEIIRLQDPSLDASDELGLTTLSYGILRQSRFMAQKYRRAPILPTESASEIRAEQAGEIIDLLLSARAEFGKPIVFGSTPLAVAAMMGNVTAVKKLLEAGAVADERFYSVLFDENEKTPLSLAAETGNEGVFVELLRERVVVELLRARANPRSQDSKGLTPLLYAIKNNDAPVISHLLNTVSQPETTGTISIEILHLLKAAGVDEPLVAGPLAKGYFRTILSNAVRTSCQHAIRGGLTSPLRKYRLDIEKGVPHKEPSFDLERQDELSQAVKYGNVQKAESLLAHESFVLDLKRDSEGMTPLLWSAVTGNVEMIRLLLGRRDYDLATLKEACDKARLWRHEEAAEHLSQALQCSRVLRPTVDRSQQVQSSQTMSAILERKSLKRKRTTKDDGNAYLGRPAKRSYSIQQISTEEDKNQLRDKA